MNDKIEKALYHNQNYDRRQIKTKKAIIGAFFKLLEEKDVTKISITELAKLADIDRKTFYLHYDSINDLYNDLGNMIVSVIKHEILAYTGSEMPEYKFFLSINEIINEKIDLFRNIAKNNKFAEFIIRIKDVLSEELTNLYRLKYNPSTERFKLTTEFVASGTISMYIKWLRGDVDITMDELALLAAEMIVNGASGLVTMI